MKKEYVECPNCKMFYELPDKWKKQGYTLCPHCDIYFEIDCTNIEYRK